MVQDHKLDGVFHALSDATRRAMLRQLARGERKIGDLAAPFDMSFAAASKHVRVLETVGLVKRRVDGRTHLCSLAPAPLRAADEWLRFYESFWSARFDMLDEMFKAQNETRLSKTKRKPV
jgi:DNA-binding transcriptional ArsR family regulator